MRAPSGDGCAPAAAISGWPVHHVAGPLLPKALHAKGVCSSQGPLPGGTGLPQLLSLWPPVLCGAEPVTVQAPPGQRPCRQDPGPSPPTAWRSCPLS